MKTDIQILKKNRHFHEQKQPIVKPQFSMYRFQSFRGLQLIVEICPEKTAQFDNFCTMKVHESTSFSLVRYLLQVMLDRSTSRPWSSWSSIVPGKAVVQQLFQKTQGRNDDAKFNEIPTNNHACKKSFLY